MGFSSKVTRFEGTIIEKLIFGKVATHVHVIEFQKSRLPHAHILIILRP